MALYCYFSYSKGTVGAPRTDDFPPAFPRLAPGDQLLLLYGQAQDVSEGKPTQVLRSLNWLPSLSTPSSSSLCPAASSSILPLHKHLYLERNQYRKHAEIWYCRGQRSQRICTEVYVHVEARISIASVQRYRLGLDLKTTSGKNHVFDHVSMSVWCFRALQQTS